MAYALSLLFDCGVGQAGQVANLRADVLDTSAAIVTGAIATGFAEIGSGKFLWTYGGFPAGHRGAVRVYNTGAPSTILAAVAINPNGPEYLDARVSDLAWRGDGSVFVDQDYGGTDALSARDAFGAGIDNVIVQIYLTDSYDAGNTGNAFVVARTMTTNGGRWMEGVYLDPGDYTIIYHKQSCRGLTRLDFTVT